LTFALCTKSAILHSRPWALGLNSTLWEAGLRFCWRERKSIAIFRKQSKREL